MFMRGRAAIITAFDPFAFKGGIETFTINLISLLESYGVKADLYHAGMVPPAKGFANDLIGRAYSLGRKLLRTDEQYDLIIANSFYGLGYFPPKLKSVNVYHSSHIGFAESLKAVIPHHVYLEWKVLCGELCETVSGFDRLKIAVSESVRDELRRYYGLEAVEVVPHGIDTKTFSKRDKAGVRAEWGIPEDFFTGLYVGRWDDTKGSSITAEVIKRSPEIMWVLIIGTGSDQNMLPRGDNIKVIEQVDHERMSEIYSAADFMLFPSRYEAFGYVIIEAMACELPVITSNVGIAQTIYKTEPFCGLLLPDFEEGPENIVSSAIDKIGALRSDPDRRSSLGRESRKVVMKHYSIDIWSDRMAEVLGLK